MQRYRIRHHTIGNHDAQEWLQDHSWRLRPSEDHKLRSEVLGLGISPTATLLAPGCGKNLVAIASFLQPASSLTILSKVLIQQDHQLPWLVPRIRWRCSLFSLDSLARSTPSLLNASSPRMDKNDWRHLA
ncbi:MAG: hypothetical protein ACK5N0_05885 [Synechococcaceae cyanobacterium]